MIHLQNIIGRLAKKYGHCKVKWTFMMANCEIVDYIDYIEIFTTFLQMLLANKENNLKKFWVL